MYLDEYDVCVVTRSLDQQQARLKNEIGSLIST